VPALLAGKHVMLEKPMEISVEGCDRLLAAQRESGTALGIICQHRFDNASQPVHRSVNNGELGLVILADCRVPGYRTQEHYDSGDWRGTRELDGGGRLINQGVHTIDLLRWICGPATSVYAQPPTSASRARRGVRGRGVRRRRSGQRSGLNRGLSRLPGPTRRARNDRGRRDRGGPAGVARHDRARAARWGGRERPRTQVATGGTRAATSAVAEVLESSDPADIWGEAHRRRLLDFVDAVEGGRTPFVDGFEGRNAVKLVQAIYRASRTGEVVAL
jgi:UDP-N-acetyl-2-amino-2-deoxyglucuronate dehydrogenase